MTADKVAGFLQSVRQDDSALRLLETAARDSTPEAFLLQVQSVARTRGFELSPGEAAEATKAMACWDDAGNAELGDEQLEGVAGAGILSGIGRTVGRIARAVGDLLPDPK